MNKPEISKMFAALRAEREAFERDRPKRLEEGAEALRRLLPIAQSDTGQSRIIAKFLLGLYNGSRFPFDLTDFRGLDRELFFDCLTVLRMDYQALQEVHRYFPDGGAVWEKLAADWNVVDVWKLTHPAGRN